MAINDGNEPPIGGGAFGARRSRGTYQAIKAKFSLDATGLRSVNTELTTMKASLKEVRTELEKIKRLGGTDKIFGGGKGGGSGGYRLPTREGDTGVTPARTAYQIDTRFSGGRGGDGGDLSTGAMAAGGRGFAIFEGFQQLTSVLSSLKQSFDTRVNRAYEYSLAADKMSVMYQQTTGMSQREVMANYRTPLTNYRLGGPEGINTLMGMQATTGISALRQASSVEAMRASSGYSLSTQDAAGLITNLGSPEVANRMFMMTGMSLYGIGGTQNRAIDVYRRLAQASGLTNPNIARGAMQQGSNVRGMLSMMGAGEELQTEVIRYAQQNLAFKQKGGRGAYDPSLKEHRRVLGVEENFATQQEETLRLQTRREEGFYQRQADNFATLERQTQTLTKAFGALEDKLSGIAGTAISNKPALGAAGKGLSMVGPSLMAAGLVATGTAAGAPLGIPLMIAGGIASAAGAMLGDPMDTGSSRTTPTTNMTYPTYNGKKTLTEIKGFSNFKKLHPEMQNRLSRLILSSGGRVGFGGGFRSSQRQKELFLERHVESSEPTKIKWNGKYWKRVRGAPAAPPGRSMHEVGLAADLTGDMGWLTANASKFGLKTFADVNNEPWHVQPTELPSSRADYEKAGAPWGTPGGAAPFNENDMFGGPETHDRETGLDRARSAQSQALLKVNQLATSEMGIAEALDRARAEHFASWQVSNMYVGQGTTHRRRASTSTTAALSGGGSALSGSEIVGLLSNAGWKGQSLIEAVGISYRESTWNPRAYNPRNRDNSYGLFQINMKNDDPENPGMGTQRLKTFGLSRNEDLFDPRTNVRVAKQLYDSSKWDPWDQPGGPLSGVNLAAAATTVRDATRGTQLNTTAMQGDPIDNTVSRAMSSTTVVHGGTNITVAPVISINAQNLPQDLESMAKQVATMLRREVDIVMMRST